MLFFFMLINFLDKTIMGLAGDPIMRELRISHLQFGAITSSFFFLFSISAILMGFLVNHIQSRWVLLGMAIVWGVAQFPMFGVVSATTLMGSRILLGAGEGPAYPVAIHAAYKWFSDDRRVLPTAIIGQGASVGVVFGLPVLNWMLITWSWHLAFGALGIVAIVWALVWLAIGREGDGDARPVTVEEPQRRSRRAFHSHRSMR